MNRIVILILSLLVSPLIVFADAFVPEFNTMQTIRCDFEESVYNQDGSFVSKSNRFRIFKLDDENQKIYLQKEPIDWVLYYGKDKVQFNLQSMTDDVIIMSNTVIDRNTMTYNSISEITYDNFMFGTRKAKASGFCKIVN